MLLTVPSYTQPGALNPDNDRPFPADDALAEEVEARCKAAFLGYVGRPFDLSVYEITYFMPLEDGWHYPGYGIYWCLVLDPSGESVGSAQDSDL